MIFWLSSTELFRLNLFQGVMSVCKRTFFPSVEFNAVLFKLLLVLSFEIGVKCVELH